MFPGDDSLNLPPFVEEESGVPRGTNFKVAPGAPIFVVELCQCTDMDCHVSNLYAFRRLYGRLRWASVKKCDPMGIWFA